MKHILSLLVIPFVAFGQGPLGPPPGPPVPSMKTLDQVEPRIAVNVTTTPPDSSSAYVISQPGSYYLQANVNAGGKVNGISIQASGVTLDLSGYQISGASTAAVRLTAGSRATVRGGTLDASGGTSALRAQGELVAEDLFMRGASDYAAYADAAATLRRCLIANAAMGAYLSGGSSLVDHCVIRDITGGPGVTFRGTGSELRDSTLSKIDLTAPYTQGVDLGGSGHRVLNNSISPVGGRGILATGVSHEVRGNHIVVVPTGPALEADSNRVVFRDNTFASSNYPNGRINGQDGGGNFAVLTTNSSPTAVISAPSSVSHGLPINLSGASSFDTEGDALTYDWQILQRPAAGAGISGSGENVSLPATPASPLASGIYRFQLVVTDALGAASSPYIVQVIVADNQAPTAVLDRTTTTPKAGQVCVLSGSRSFDTGGGSIVRYTFTLVSRPAGSTRPLNTPVQQTTPTFNGFTPDVIGTYQWRLVVTDDSGNDSLPDVINIVVSS
ncbi:MAG: hypothetical protein EOP83_05890 [Verrucomicrobiaceae bacterium]|nr:MAG: hypothetical protein EOP83_05890 [Verrucomicrobiaceae bacterium]